MNKREKVRLHVKQHFVRWYCPCRMSSASRDTLTAHQRTRHLTPEHGGTQRTIYGVDAAGYQQFCKDTQWRHPPHFPGCHPTRNPEGQASTPTTTKRKSTSRPKPTNLQISTSSIEGQHARRVTKSTDSPARKREKTPSIQPSRVNEGASTSGGYQIPRVSNRKQQTITNSSPTVRNRTGGGVSLSPRVCNRIRRDGVSTLREQPLETRLNEIEEAWLEERESPSSQLPQSSVAASSPPPRANLPQPLDLGLPTLRLPTIMNITTEELQQARAYDLGRPDRLDITTQTRHTLDRLLQHRPRSSRAPSDRHQHAQSLEQDAARMLADAEELIQRPSLQPLRGKKDSPSKKKLQDFKEKLDII
jgi:hypothetical protein